MWVTVVWFVALFVVFFLLAYVQPWVKRSDVLKRRISSFPNRAFDMSMDTWSVAHTNVDDLSEDALVINFQCFRKPDKWQELIIRPDHKEYEKFRRLKPADMVDFDFHSNKIAGAVSEELSSYLGIRRVSPPGAYISHGT